MSCSRSADLRCVELDNLADELVAVYRQLNEDQILLLHDSVNELDRSMASIHRRIATHRMTCEVCIQINEMFRADQKDGRRLN